MLKAISKITILLALLSSILINSPVARAEVIVFEDDFSNGLNKWESVRNNFDMWSIVNDQANAFINTGSTLAELVPNDLHWSNEWKNIIYELDYKYIQGADKNISFGFIDVYNWYEIHFVNNRFYLSHVKNGEVVWDHTGTTGMADGITHHFSIHLNEGLIIISIDGLEVINTVDPTFDNDYGKIGIKASTGSIWPTHSIYDNIIVKLLNDLTTKLNTVVQKQTDPNWAGEEYDSAKSWAGNENASGIDHWGCLISSISMIMNFHDIDKMPDDNPVNPSTINSWLKSQPDGYIGSGLVNWLAITRLTKIINEQYSTPKFEYKRIYGDDLNIAQNEIKENKPVVLQVLGHFFVGDGIVENDSSDDLYITDPSYAYEKLSQHQQPLLSTRTLTPTFTDLSYIHLSHNSNINIEIKNEDGSEIHNLQSFEDYIQDFVSDENLEGGGFSENNSPSTKIYEIEKPESGNYIIEVSQGNFESVDFAIFTYNKNGDLSDLSYSGTIGQNKTQFKLSYDNEGNSSITKITNFYTLPNNIEELEQLNEIKKHYVATELRKLALFGATSSPENYLRYVNALQQLLEWYAPQITEGGKLYLEERLLEIK